MNDLIEELAQVCRGNLLGEKIIIAPSLAIGHQIGDALAQSGTSWINLRFESVRTLTDAVVGFEVAEAGLKVLSRAQALGLIEKACDRALPADSYFSSLADRPGLHRAIQRTIDDLRLAGVRLSAVPRASFEDERKARDLEAVLVAYEEELSRGKYIDRPGLLTRATARLEGEGALGWPADTTWILLEDVELSSEEERFLELVSTGRLRRLTSAPLSSDPPRNLELFPAVGEENELRAAFRATLGEGRSFDSAEIIYTRQDPYLPLAYELAAELEIPCTFAEGIAASYTRPGQACLMFLQWCGDGWEATALQRAARGGALAMPLLTDPDDPPGAERLSPTSFSRILRDARIGWGRARYLERIDAWIAERELLAAEAEESHAASRRREVSRAKAAREVVQRLLSISHGIAEGEEIDMSMLAAAASRLVKELAAVRSEIDAMAQSGLRRMLDELADLPSTMVTRQEGTERLREAVRHLYVAASNPRPGHLHVAPLRAGGWSGRAKAFVVGLDDAKYPGSGLQDPILLDSERGEINQGISPRRLQLRGEAPERMTMQLTHLLQRLEHCDNVFVSFPMIDLIERRDLYPSSAILELYRRASGKKDATYDEALATMGATAGFVDPRVPLNESEWWLSRVRPAPSSVAKMAASANASPKSGERRDGAGSLLDGVGRLPTQTPLAAVGRAYPWLASGAEAMAARASSELTKWDGLIDAPREEVDPRYTGKVYSASQLESMAKCPIGYFFERHLRIEPLDELQRDPDVWLNAMENGSLFHSIAERFMKEICRGGARVGKQHRDRLEAIADEELQSWRRAVPPPNETAFRKRRDELFETLTVFLRGEVECGSVAAKFFEAAFGYPEKNGDEITMADPLLLDLGDGRSIKIRGKIDRIDLDEASGLWNVWDYKTGSTFDYRDGESLARGTRIQHAVYARAICEMLARRGIDGTVGQSGYYFPTPRGRAKRQARSCGPGELEHALNLLFDVVGRGFFPHPTEEACRFCDYAAVCGDRRVAAEQMQEKFEANIDHPAVRAWLALQGIR